MMNPTKFGSLHLDTPSSRYEFLKLVFKCVKKKENQTNRQTDRWDLRSTGPTHQRTRIEAAFDWPLLVASEVTGGEVTTDGFASTYRIDGCTWLARRSTGACSPPAMADGGGCTVVRRWSSTTICSSDNPYGSVVLQRI